MKSNKIYLIKWKDICSYTNENAEGEQKTPEYKTVGWLHSQRKEGKVTILRFISSMAHDGVACDFIEIPEGCIYFKKELREGN